MEPSSCMFYKKENSAYCKIKKNITIKFLIEFHKLNVIIEECKTILTFQLKKHNTECLMYPNTNSLRMKLLFVPNCHKFITYYFFRTVLFISFLTGFFLS